MKPQFLLDTHALIFIRSKAKLISTRVRKILSHENVLLLSSVSVWEMSIKISLGKLILPSSLEEFIQEFLPAENIKLLNISLPHLFALRELNLVHRDPFDRLLISQAIFESVAIISNDSIFDQYGVKRVW